MDHITAEEAKRLIEEEHARLIDVREDHEWEEARIPGAELVPLSELEMDPELVEAEGVMTIFQCAHGQRSITAAEIYEGVHPQGKAASMEGGISSWMAKGFPVDTDPPSE